MFFEERQKTFLYKILSEWTYSSNYMSVWWKQFSNQFERTGFSWHCKTLVTNSGPAFSPKKSWTPVDLGAHLADMSDLSPICLYFSINKTPVIHIVKYGGGIYMMPNRGGFASLCTNNAWADVLYLARIWILLHLPGFQTNISIQWL